MRKKKPFHDPAPDIHDFPGVPESTFDLVNQYGTYNIQPTSHTQRLCKAAGVRKQTVAGPSPPGHVPPINCSS